MSVRHTGADLGRSLTGDFTEDDTERLRGRVWMAFALFAFVLAGGALGLLMQV
jgi:hypothetical protein